MKSTNRKAGLALGFTLIELLIVIAIIAILAAILFPVFASARNKARATACLSNLKQIGTAVMQYTQDFDETFPCGNKGLDSSHPTNGASDSPTGWAGQIYPYVKTTQVFLCPSDSTQPGATTTPSTTYTYVISYAMNYCLGTRYNQVGGSSTDSGWTQGTQLSLLGAPSKTVFLTECMGVMTNITNPKEDHSPITTGYDGYPLDSQSISGLTGILESGSGYWSNACRVANNETPATLPSQHGGGGNYLAADGHAKYLMPDFVSIGYEPQASTYTQTTCADPAGTTSMQASVGGVVTNNFTLTYNIY